MAVTSREIRGERRPFISSQFAGIGSLAYLITGVLALLAIYVLLSNAVSWGTKTLNDLRYGNPRTFHLSAAVGHGDESSSLTHFIALNLNRQIIVLEIPGGDSTQIRSLPGPYLFGAGEDLTPVTMRVADMNGDTAADLVVQVKNEEMVYLNRDGQFHLITSEERQQLVGQP